MESKKKKPKMLFRFSHIEVRYLSVENKSDKRKLRFSGKIFDGPFGPDASTVVLKPRGFYLGCHERNKKIIVDTAALEEAISKPKSHVTIVF